MINHLRLYMFQRFFSFEGRIRRSEFFTGRLLISFGLTVVLLFSAVFNSPALHLLIIVTGSIVLFYSMMAQSAKRCHDMGYSGWFQIIPLFDFVMLFVDGQPYENEYGPDPKGRDGIRPGQPDPYSEILDSERFK